MKVLDLFSGIGGFSRGLERAGMETVAFCEIDPYCRRVLAKHWPGVPIHDDITQLDGEQYRGTADVVCGGFPCQDLSVAGKQAGIEGARSGLWGELARIIGEVRPRYAIVENVPALLSGDSGRWFGRVLGDLASLGFDAEWHCIPAAAVGAPHRRDRVWLVAYAQRDQLRQQPKPVIGRGCAAQLGHDGEEGSFDGFCSCAQGRCEILGNPNIGVLEGQRSCWQQELRARYVKRKFEGAGDGAWGQWSVEPDVGRVADGVPPKLDGDLNGYAQTMAGSAGITADDAVSRCVRALRQYGESGEAPSQLRRPGSVRDPVSSLPFRLARARAAGATDEELRCMWDAVSAEPLEEAQDMLEEVLERAWQTERQKTVGERVNRLRALGNAVVPQVVELIGRAIMEAEHA